MTYKKLQIVSFLIFLLAIFILTIQVIRPFLGVLAFGVIISVLFWPIYNKIYARIKSANIASLLTVLLVLLIVLLPLWLFGQVIFNEAFGLYYNYKDGGLSLSANPFFGQLSPTVQDAIGNVVDQVRNAADSFTNNAFQTVSGLLSNVLSFFLAAFLFFFTVFFVLRDGEHLKKVITDISPIAQEQEDILFKKIDIAVNGVIKGAFLTALIQGVAATVGFFAFGVPNPLLWGLFTVIAALVPTVGTSLSLIPAVVYLFLTGHTFAAVGLAIWGALAVGLIDNLIGPKLIGATTKLHPLLVFISVLGGVQLFGFAGFLFGPIIMAIFIALIDMYRTDFKEYLEQ